MTTRASRSAFATRVARSETRAYETMSRFTNVSTHATTTTYDRAIDRGDDDSRDHAFAFEALSHDAYASFVESNTTGSRVWDAARALRAYIVHDAVARERVIERAHARTIELGSGCGFLAFEIARVKTNEGEVRATETSARGAVAWLAANVQANALEAMRRGTTPGWKFARLSVREMDWVEFARAFEARREGGGGAREREAETADDERWDVVLGSDLVYDDAGTHALPVVIYALLKSRDAVCYYAHTKHRYDGLDETFFEQCARRGLDVEEMRQPGVRTPPPSPPPFESLFPDQRIAVYRITRAKVLAS